MNLSSVNESMTKIIAMLNMTSRVAKAKACDCSESPGRESRREIITGRVSAPRRARKLLAPNSPIETVAEIAAAEIAARRIILKSMLSQVWRGDAPSTLDAWRSESGIA